MPINFYKNVIIITLLLLLSCSEKQERNSITVGISHKINKLSYTPSDSNIVFQWWVGNHPDNSNYSLEPFGKTALFTPDLIGEYDVFISIRDSNDLEIKLIEFYFNAVKEKIKVKPKKIISDSASKELEKNNIDTIDTINAIDTLKKQQTDSITIKQSKTNIVKQYSGWTIQLSSRASLKLAKKDQIKAIENGYDAYIEQTNIKKTNKTWYRVRIGNFSKKTTAKIVQKEIKSFWGNDTWITRVKIK